jgi:hypothetical protein
LVVHSELPPSSSEQWMNCLGWLKAVTGIAHPPSSKFAEEGTAAHDMLELALTFDLPPEQVCDDAEMAEAIGFVTDWVSAYVTANPGTQFQSEYWIPWGIAVGIPTLGGTTDVALANPRELVIIDLKYGAGVIVEPNSEQLFCYMTGLRAMMGKRSTYRNVIIQPRARHVDGPVREKVMTDKHIDIFLKRLKLAVDTNVKGTAPRTAGDHCRWCRAAPTCRTYAEKAIAVAISEFSIVEFASSIEGPRLLE